MRPATKNIFIKRGDTFRLFFRLRKRNVDGTAGEYPDLTTWGTGLAQIRPAKTSTEVIVTMAVTKADQATYPGGVLLTIADDVTADLTLTPGLTVAVWDFQISNDLGENDTYLEGDVEFSLDVSRPSEGEP